MDTSGVFNQMIFLFIIIIIGFGSEKLHLIDEKTNTYISRLLAFVTSPLQIISTVIKPGSHPIKNKDALLLTGLALVFYFVLVFVAKLLPLVLRDGKTQNNCYEFMFIFSNVSYMGFPVIDTLFGVEYRFYGTIFVLMFNLFCWTYGVSLMSGEKFRINKKLFLRPMVFSALLAYLLYFTKLGSYCPEILYKAAFSIGDTTPVLAMLITGCALAKLTFKGVFGRWRTWVMTIFKMFIFPIVFWYIMHFIIKDRIILGVLTVMVSMPVGTNATILSYQYGGDEKLASSGVFLSTLVSVVSIPVLMNIFY